MGIRTIDVNRTDVQKKRGTLEGLVTQLYLEKIAEDFTSKREEKID